MSKLSQLALIAQMIEAAETNLRNARQLFSNFCHEKSADNLRAGLTRTATNLNASLEEEGKVIEGVFNGQNMIGPDKREYPVPTNYASKSKLISGDIMKLTINPEGHFLYKQIGPVERKRITGPLIYEDSQYKVLAEGKTYKVLHSSVSYYQATPGDKVVLLIPEIGESEWGAIDNIIPKLQAEIAAEETIIKEVQSTANATQNEAESVIIAEDPLLKTKGATADLFEEEPPKDAKKKIKKSKS